MTATHDARSIESQKERYSRELAAYTLRQWNSAYQAAEAANSQAKNNNSRSRSSSRSHRDSGKSSWMPKGQADERSPGAHVEQEHDPLSAGVQSVDYAQRSRNASNAINV